MSVQVHVIEADWHTQRDALRSIRETVFIDEQNVPRELEWDGEDEHSRHFLAVNELGVYVGCARLMPSGQIGRMAVLAEHRGLGIGAELLEACVAAATAAGFEQVFLHAQSYAADFYRKGGFIPHGQEFMEAGIPHLAMEMKLPLKFDAALDEPVRPAIRDEAPRPQQGADVSAPQTFSDLQGAASALHHVATAARRQLFIMSPYLDHNLFDTDALLEAVSALARNGQRADVRILIMNSKLIVDRGHRLLDLARRLDDKISIRLLEESITQDTSSFACADLDAYWLLPNHDQYDGVADLANAVTCKRLSDAFQTAWDKSRLDPELRTLRI